MKTGKGVLLKELLPEARWLAIAPGRVNLLGEHLDYNDGVVMPAAINRTVKLAAVPLDGSKVSLMAIDLNESVSFDFDMLDRRQDINGNPLPGWALYPAGVAWALRQRGLELPAFRGVYTADIPMGAGLSSSAAVEVAFGALWQQLGGWEMSRLDLARCCLEAETRYVGLNCGLMDQFASACGVAGHVLAFDTRSLDWQALPLPPGIAIVIADSQVPRTLTSSGYNDRHAACMEAVRLLSMHLPGISALRDVTRLDFERWQHVLPAVVARHARHVVEENERVVQALDCLRSGDAAAFGQLMYATQISLRDLYEVSVPELDMLVEIAAELPGCLGARLTGAGFGGCTVNLVEEQAAAGFIADLSARYFERSGRLAEVYLCRAGNGVQVKRWDQDD